MLTDQERWQRDEALARCGIAQHINGLVSRLSSTLESMLGYGNITEAEALARMIGHLTAPRINKEG